MPKGWRKVPSGRVPLYVRRVMEVDLAEAMKALKWGCQVNHVDASTAWAAYWEKCRLTALKPSPVRWELVPKGSSEAVRPLLNNPLATRFLNENKNCFRTRRRWFHDRPWRTEGWRGVWVKDSVKLPVLFVHSK